MKVEAAPGPSDAFHFGPHAGLKTARQPPGSLGHQLVEAAGRYWHLLS